MIHCSRYLENSNLECLNWLPQRQENLCFYSSGNLSPNLYGRGCYWDKCCFVIVLANGLSAGTADYVQITTSLTPELPGRVTLTHTHQAVYVKIDCVIGTLNVSGCFNMLTHIICSSNTLKNFCHVAIFYIFGILIELSKQETLQNLLFFLHNKSDFIYKASPLLFCLSMYKTPWCAFSPL